MSAPNDDHRTDRDEHGGEFAGRVIEFPAAGQSDGDTEATTEGAGFVNGAEGTVIGPPVAPVPNPPAVVHDAEAQGTGTGTEDTGAAGVVVSGRDGRVLVDQPGPAGSRDMGWMERTRSASRRPLVPVWATTRDGVTETARWFLRHVAYVVAFHLIRAPRYAVAVLGRAARGLGRVLVAIARWVRDEEGSLVRRSMVRAEDAETYLKLTRVRDARVKTRAPVLVFGVIVSAVGGWLLWAFTNGAVITAVITVLVLVLARIGAPADARPLIGAAVVNARAAKLTSDVVTAALLSLGIGGMTATARGAAPIAFVAPIHRHGPGWRAEVDLPMGITVSDVMERRDKLASGLRRPLGCVWPEPVHTEHTGRLVLWVGDEDMSRAKPTAWPLARKGRADLFAPVPFGADQRGERVAVPLVFNNVLIGSIPRQGKTFAMRTLVLGCALDPRAELRVFELKGTGDLSAVAGCAHHYGSGADDDTIAACLASLEEVYTDLERRAAVIRGLPREVCPENKVTPELAARRELGLHPLVVAVDECQELFSNPTHGAKAGDLVTAIIKRGPAMGVIVILATQRPDAKSLPTGVSSNMSVRLCLRVIGQTENDMILGTSFYKNGVRATTFTARDKGIGYLVGVADDPQIVRSDYIDAPTAERIGQRARGVRETAGRLTGHAAGLDTHDALAGPADTVLADVLAVMPATEAKTWSENLVARLAVHRPATYGGWAPAQLSSALTPHGVKTVQVWATPDDGDEPGNKRGIRRADVLTAYERTDPGTTGGPSNTDGDRAGGAR